MADVTVNKAQHKTIASGDGCAEYYGMATWPAGATSATLPVPLKVIDEASFCHVGAVASTDGQPSISDTPQSGRIVRPASGKLTLVRPAATTSAPSFHFRVRGV